MKENKKLDNSNTIDINFLRQPCYCLDIEQHYLAINDAGLKELHANIDEKDVLGKTPYDIYSKEKADTIVQKHQQVIRTGEIIQVKESIQHTKKNTQHYHVTIMPLYDNKSNIIKTSAIFMSIDNKQYKKPISANSQTGAGIFKQLEEIAEVIPAAFYWLNLDQVVLGVNNLSVDIVKECSTSQKIIGATIHDLYPKDIADALAEDHRTVIATNKPLITTEVAKNIKTGKLQYYEVTIAPLHDEQGNIIGTYGLSIDVTEKKEASDIKTKENVLKQLEEIANTMPVPFYWTDINHIILGVNNVGLEAAGIGNSPEKAIKKSIDNIYPKDIAEKLIKNQRIVIETDKPLTTQESVINLVTGDLRHYEAIIAPLHDDKRNIIGTYGLSIDITAEKEAEKFRHESELKQAKLEQQEKFKQVISQAVHDIHSPLASLTMLIKSCEEVPESTRIALRESANSINDIAESLLDRWMADKQPVTDTEKEEKFEPMVIYLALMQTLTSKRFQYQNSSIVFSLDVEKECYFDCINVQGSNFKRMVSNLLNNAVRAYADELGEIKIKLQRTRNQGQDQVKIVIDDKGKGIPPEVLDKIRKKISITHDKVGGHGIGLIQVQETLSKNHGQFTIDSEVGKGTSITLTFPRIATPVWLAKKIEISSNDTVVILDDDDSIHAAWDSRFQSILEENPRIQLKHFFSGQEALDFIESFKEKDKLFLLTDYELLKQQYNGLDIIEKTKTLRSILVTSHYANPDIQTRATSIGTRILPKQLASEVAIVIESTDVPLQKVDLVIADDDANFIDTFCDYAFSDYHVAIHNCPEALLDNLSSYSKTVIFLLDYEFKNSAISGLNLPQQLLKKGYSNVFILSGRYFAPDKVPEGITILRKSEFDKIKNIVEHKMNVQQSTVADELKETDKTESVLNSLTTDADWIALFHSFIHDLNAPLTVVKMSEATLSPIREKFRQGYELAVAHQLMEPMAESRFLKRLRAPDGSLELIPKHLDLLQDFIDNFTHYTNALNKKSLTSTSIRAQLNTFVDHYPFSRNSDRKHIRIDITNDFALPCSSIFINGLFQNAFNYFFNALKENGNGYLRFSTKIDNNRRELHIEDTAYETDKTAADVRFESFFLQENQQIYPGWGFCRLALRRICGDIECEMLNGQHTRIIAWVPN